MILSPRRLGFLLSIWLALVGAARAGTYLTSDGRLQLELPDRFVPEKSPDAKTLPGKPVNYEFVFTARDVAGRQGVSVVMTPKSAVSVFKSLRDFAVATVKSENEIGHATSDATILKLADGAMTVMRSLGHANTNDSPITLITLFAETHDSYMQIHFMCPQRGERQAMRDSLTLAGTLRDAKSPARRPTEPATKPAAPTGALAAIPPATNPLVTEPAATNPATTDPATTNSTTAPASKLWITPDGSVRVSLGLDWQPWNSAAGKGAIRATNQTLKVILSIDASPRDGSTLMDFAEQAQKRATDGIQTATLSPIEAITIGQRPAMRYDVSIKSSEDDIAICGVAMETPGLRLVAKITGDSAGIAAAREELIAIVQTLRAGQ